jgi:tetratricopeptide (TPR) repeat protein
LLLRFAVPILLIAGACACLGANGSGVNTDPLNYDPLVREAYQHFYILDYDGAVSRFEKVAEAHPNEPIATAYLLNATLFRELYRLDLLDTTFYANDGFLTGRHPVPEDPKARDRIFFLTDRAVGLAEQRLRANSNDVNALYVRGWARSLKAAYLAMVERSFSTGFHYATQARNDEDRVLEIDPSYIDAKMVAGVYQYVVGALPLPFKFMIGFAGIHGSKSTGMQMLRDAANRGVITKVESKTVIALFLRREGKYQEAIGFVRQLKDEYPRDFLFCLEEANLLKDAGQGPQSIAAYHALLEQAKQPGYFPSAHLDLAWFGLAETLRGQHIYAEAATAYQHAAWQPDTGAELRRRSLVAAGQVFDLMNDRKRAMESYHSAIDAGPDSTQADLARKYLKSPYTGR